MTGGSRSALARHPFLTRQEVAVAVALACATLLWLAMPPVTQPGRYHEFADQRTWLGVPYAADVLSNVGFLIVGLLGIVRMQTTLRPLVPAVRIGLYVLFIGLFLTGFASAYYHWAPADDALVVDRLAMTIVFAGVFGAMVAERISARAGLAVLLLMMVIGPASVLLWQRTGDLSLYAVVQFGGMLYILLLLSFTPRGADPFPWWALIAWYAVSKVAEAGDALVWHATREVVAGHALKHLAAAAGGLAIANALRNPRRPKNAARA
ncbi:MAG: hypothetical protein U1F48_17050 [Burkholderiales bacterium]